MDQRGGMAVLRMIIYATLIVILTMGAASAQTGKPMGLPEYSNAVRTMKKRKTIKQLIAPMNRQ
jgi:hypothetical protein